MKKAKFLSLLTALFLITGCQDNGGDTPVDPSPVDPTPVDPVNPDDPEEHNHSYGEETIDWATGYAVKECTCGDKQYKVSNDTPKKFSVYSYGEPFSMEFANDTGLNVYVDDNLQTLNNKKLSVNLTKGYHDISFESTNEIVFNALTLGEKDYVVKRDGIIVEVLPATLKDDHGVYRNSFNVYMLTATKNRYIRYKFQYEFNDSRTTFTENSTTNVSNTRVKSGQFTHVTNAATCAEEGKVTVDADEFEVLQQGEISLAMYLYAPGASNYSKDAMGGYHGDERLTSQSLTQNGNGVVIQSDKAQTETKVYVCSYLEFKQSTEIFYYGTSTADSYGDKMCNHSQHFEIDANRGVQNRNSIEWTAEGYKSSRVYMEMLTIRREVNGNYVMEDFEMFKPDGTSLGKASTTLNNEDGQKLVGSYENAGNRIHYSSKHTKFTCDSHFDIPEESACTIKQSYVKVRKSQGDNKLYCNFETKGKTTTIEKGSNWIVDVNYKIDFNDPEISKQEDCEHDWVSTGGSSEPTIDHDGGSESFVCTKCGATKVEEGKILRNRILYSFDNDNGIKVVNVNNKEKDGFSMEIGSKFSINSGSDNTFKGTSIANSSTDTIEENYNFVSGKFIQLTGKSQVDQTNINNYIKIIVPEAVRIIFYVRSNSTTFNLSISNEMKIDETTILGDAIRTAAQVRYIDLEAGTYYISRYGAASSSSTASDSSTQMRIYGIEFIFAK